MKNSNRSFDVLQSLDGIKEMSLEELRDILQALNEKVKSSLALRCNYLESDFAAFLEDAASDCAFQIKKKNKTKQSVTAQSMTASWKTVHAVNVKTLFMATVQMRMKGLQHEIPNKHKHPAI